jgi:beta-lactamase class D
LVVSLRLRIVCASLLVLSLAAPLTSFSSNPESRSGKQLDALFHDSGVSGTFILYDVSDDRLVIHNQARAETRFIPASTFKIPNSLIGLATAAVTDVDEIIPYGGKPQFLKIWEKDMGLRDAIRISNVPVYQELARRIGLSRMSEYVTLLDYGNKTIGDHVDMFWLAGPLQISAIEQSRFLARLAQGQLPLPLDVQKNVRNIVKVEQGDGWILYAKTGWANSTKPAIGWWVGWVEKDGHIFSFALNIDMPEIGDAAKRVQLGKACLKALGIIEYGETNVQH